MGTFDAIHFVSSDYIRFVQVTAGAKHTYYLDTVSDLLTRLAAEFLVMRLTPSTFCAAQSCPRKFDGYKR